MLRRRRSDFQILFTPPDILPHTGRPAFYLLLTPYPKPPESYCIDYDFDHYYVRISRKEADQDIASIFPRATALHIR